MMKRKPARLFVQSVKPYTWIVKIRKSISVECNIHRVAVTMLYCDAKPFP